MAKISDGIAILDSIASRNMGFSPAVMGFDMFSVEMTEAIVDSPEEGITFAAMVRTPGMKERESKLWALKPATAQQAAQCEQAEKQARFNADASDYASNENHEIDCEPITLAIGLAKAFALHCPGEIPYFLLDENGELGFDVQTNSNMVSNRKIARKHDRSRRKAD